MYKIPMRDRRTSGRGARWTHVKRRAAYLAPIATIWLCVLGRERKSELWSERRACVDRSGFARRSDSRNLKIIKGGRGGNESARVLFGPFVISAGAFTNSQSTGFQVKSDFSLTVKFVTFKFLI
jgi:hypothetical protein